MRYVVALAIAVLPSLVTPQTPRIEQQFALVDGRATCVPYTATALRIVEAKGEWHLRRDGDGFMIGAFTEKADAEAGLAVAKEYTCVCSIGKSFDRPSAAFRYLRK